MPPKSSKKVTSNTQVEEENDENVPPQGRRSGRVKGRKSASTEEIERRDSPNDDEIDSDEGNEEEEADQEDDDDEEEAEKPRKRAKKTSAAPRKRRASGAKTNGAAKGKGRKSKTPARPSIAGEILEKECPMLDALLDEKVALDPTVLEWIERYEEDETAAMTEMVNFILRCCGCPFEINPENVDDEDSIIETLAEIQELYKQTNPREYPLIATKKTDFRKFPKRLTEYFRRLLQKFSAKGMLDVEPSVLDKLQQWVFSLSSTNFRPFRHTATVISLGFITTLCEIYAKVNKAHDNSNMSLEKEKKGKKTARIKELERMAEEQERQLKTLTDLMESTYDSVFVHRFRDVDHRIRTECVHELGLWMQRLPQIYFDAAHLRYMGWALSDSNVATRLDVVKSLQKLYEAEEYISNLRHFTERFQTRFVEMATSDADRGVRVATIVLLDNIRQRDLLEPEDVDKISLMIFDPESRIRKAVTGIFLSNVEAQYEETLEGIGGNVEAVEKELGDDVESADGIPHTWLKFNALVKVLAKYDQQVDQETEEDETDKVPYKGFELGDVQSRIVMAASAIIAEMEELHNWDNLASYLLRDHSTRPNERGRNANSILAKARRACTLSPPEEVILLEVLNTAIRIRRDNEDENEAAKGKKRKRSASEQPDDDDIDVSTGLVRKLPDLIRRFGSKPETAAQILRMVQYVKLDKYDELRQLEALEALLEDVGKQFMNHTDASVFKEASASLLHAQKFESLGHITEPKVIELQDEVNTTFLGTVNGKNLVTAAFTTDELSDLTTAVARLENLLSVTDCTMAISDDNTKQGKSSFSLLLVLLERSRSTHDAEEIEMISHALKAIRWYFMWQIRAIASHEDGVNEESLNVLREKKSDVIDELNGIIKDRPADDVKVQATTLLLDLYTLFTTIDETTRNNLLNADDYQLPQAEQDNIINVFEEEIHLLRLSEKKSKNIATGEDDEEEDEDEEMPDVADLSPETRGAIHERRVCDLAGKMVLAILGGALPKTFTPILHKEKGKVGQSYDKIVLELGAVPEPKVAAVKKAPTPASPVVEREILEQIEVGSEMDDA